MLRKRFWAVACATAMVASMVVVPVMADEETEAATEVTTEAATEAATIKFVMSMHSKGYTTAQIADVAEMEEKQIEEIIKNADLLSA